MAARKKGGKGGMAKTKRRPPKQPSGSKGELSATSSTAKLSLAVVVLAAAWQLAHRKGYNHQLVANDDYQSSGTISREASGEETFDPWVDVIPSVIPSSTCNEVIVRSEKIGYRLFNDSIDEGESENYNQQAQEVYIFHKKRVVEPTLYALIEPYLPKLSEAIRRRKELVSDRYANERSFTHPSIEWIFLRKYFPLGKYSKRNSLKVHMDSNMHSVTLALNDNYVGGGLFVVRPRNRSNQTDNNLHLPEVPKEYASYRWLHNQDQLTKQRNSSSVFFPALPQGSAALINFTVPHGVAPLAQESPVPRYALIVFYNIDEFYDIIYPSIDEYKS